MSFLDTFKKKTGVVAEAASSVAQNAVQQSKTLASVGRVKLAIASEEDKMKKAYTELGRLFYRDYEAQTEADMEDYQSWCDKVADAKAQIQRLNEELEKLRAPETPEEQPEPEAEPEIEVEFVVSDPEPAPADEAPEAPAEVPETPEAPEIPETPTVGTLYVDVTDTEE